MYTALHPGLAHLVNTKRAGRAHKFLIDLYRRTFEKNKTKYKQQRLYLLRELGGNVADRHDGFGKVVLMVTSRVIMTSYHVTWAA
jgi:hypothetical protein